MKILNLNIWNYHNFKERKPKIIKFIRKHNPDIVTLQEVRDDLQFNRKGYNQAKQLQEKLGYPFCSFMKTMDVNKVNKTPKNLPCFEGVAILSKFPMTKIVKKKLKKHQKDEYTRGILHARINDKDIIVVHFSPNDLFSKLHLKETLKYAKQKRIKPIIIGDFNIRKKQILKLFLPKNYISSSNIKKYISYMPAKYTLDYIIVHRNLHFKSFSCIGTGLSDHKALLAEIV